MLPDVKPLIVYRVRSCRQWTRPENTVRRSRAERTGVHLEETGIAVNELAHPVRTGGNLRVRRSRHVVAIGVIGIKACRANSQCLRYICWHSVLCFHSIIARCKSVSNTMCDGCAYRVVQKPKFVWYWLVGGEVPRQAHINQR